VVQSFFVTRLILLRDRNFQQEPGSLGTRKIQYAGKCQNVSPFSLATMRESRPYVICHNCTD